MITSTRIFQTNLRTANSLYNDAGHGSVKHYVEGKSYGALLVDTTVVGWIDVSQTHEYAVAGDFGKNKAQADKRNLERSYANLENDPSYNIDFADFDVDNDGFIDTLTIVHSGMYSFYSYYCLLKTNQPLTILCTGAGAEEGGNSGLDCEGVSYTDRIWLYSTRQSFFNSSGGI